MKSVIFTLFFLFLLLGNVTSAWAWGNRGHAAIIALAERHLTPKVKAYINARLGHDMIDDATWMDPRRTNEWGFTADWHVIFFDEKGYYTPDPDIRRTSSSLYEEDRGDALYAFNKAIYMLSDDKQLSDSAFTANMRYLLHFLGDVHCPVHCLIPGRTAKYASVFDGKEYMPAVSVLVPVKFGETEYKSYHAFIDKTPQLLFPGKNARQIAEALDTSSKRQIKRTVIGKMSEVGGHLNCTPTLLIWAHDCALQTQEMWKRQKEIVYDLDAQTTEQLRDIVENEMRSCGYRLAWVLNSLFDR